ncbi:MAG: esterase, partial [Mycobacterium sp.]
PDSGLAIGFVHNRLLTPLVVTDHAAFVGLYALTRRAVATARKRGYRPVRSMGAPYWEAGAVAG